MPAAATERDGIVNLVAIGQAARPLAAWWRRLLELGQPGLQRLDQARKALTALPPVPGRLGRAIALVVACEETTADADMAAAIALLVELAERLDHAGVSGAGNGGRPGAAQQLQLRLGNQSAS